MVIFRPSIPLSPQQQGRLQLLGCPAEVLDGTKFEVQRDSPAPCPDPEYAFACVGMSHSPSFRSHGYNEGLSTLSLSSLIAQPALELKASLAAGLRCSREKTAVSIVPESSLFPYPKQIDLEDEGQVHSNRTLGSFSLSNSTQIQEISTLQEGHIEESIQTPDTNEKTPPRASNGAVSTKLDRPSLQGNIWLLGSTNSSKNSGVDAPVNPSASEQASSARFTPPDTPSPENNKAVLHRPPALSIPNSASCSRSNEGQHAQQPSKHDDSSCSAFKPQFDGDDNIKKQRYHNSKSPPMGPLILDDKMCIASNIFIKEQEDNIFSSPTKLDEGKSPVVKYPSIIEAEARSDFPASLKDLHLDAAETLSSLGQAKQFDNRKRKALDLPSSRMVGESPYYSLPPQINDSLGAQSPPLEELKGLDMGKEKLTDPVPLTHMGPSHSATPEQALPWTDSNSFQRQDKSVSQEPPRCPQPGFRPLPANKPLPPELHKSIDGCSYGKGEPPDLPPTPRPTPRVRFKPLPARDPSPLPRNKIDELQACDRETLVFDPPICFFSESDTDSDEAIESQYAGEEPQDRMEFLAETIRNHFELSNVPETKRAYDFPERERTKRLLRFDREVATPYITEHRSVQTSTYEEEENEAPYLHAACGGMINLNKSGDLMDEHRFRWRNGFDRMEKLGKVMTIWSHRGYGPPRSYMEHDKLAHAEMKRRRDCRERRARAGKVFKRAQRAGLRVDREGFVVPRTKEAPGVPPGMPLGPSGGDSWEKDHLKQCGMMRWAEKVVTGEVTTGHDTILPSAEERTFGDSDESDSNVDDHPVQDELRFERGLVPRKYNTRSLLHLDAIDKVQSRNFATDDTRPSTMVAPSFDELMTNPYPPSAISTDVEPNPNPNCLAPSSPSWRPRHYAPSIQKHTKECIEIQKINIPKPTPTPINRELDSEDDGDRVEEERSQSTGLARASFPGWDEPMLNGRLLPSQPHDPQPAGTFCPSWDPRHFEHFVKRNLRGGGAPRVVVTMPSPEPGEDGDGWDSEDEWEEESRENLLAGNDSS